MDRCLGCDDHEQKNDCCEAKDGILSHIHGARIKSFVMGLD